MAQLLVRKRRLTRDFSPDDRHVHAPVDLVWYFRCPIAHAWILFWIHPTVCMTMFCGSPPAPTYTLRGLNGECAYLTGTGGVLVATHGRRYRGD